MALRFFLGANTKDGFFSLYPALRHEPGRRIFAVKGGPGSGKSTCIRALAARLGGAEEEILCSSDPDSLDGAIFSDLALLDGTAPHVFEPEFPGCDGEYLFLPPPLDPRGLAEKRDALAALQAAVRAEYAAAYRLLGAAALTREQRREAVRPLFPGEKAEKRALGLARRLLSPGSAPRLRLRFLDGITPKGRLFLDDTVTACARRIVALEDRFGLAQPMLETLRDQALARDLTVFVCLDPLEPRRVRHLLLPELSLALVTDSGDLPASLSPTRTIRVDAMLPHEALRPLRSRLRRLEQTERALLDEAVDHIACAHAFHDRIEALFRPHMDFSAAEAQYQTLLGRLRP